MYLKKVDGPRAITLPDGKVLTRADLPPRDTRRWVASRKLTVVLAVEHGLITLQDAIDLYDLSEEEYDLWRSAVLQFGQDALKTTYVQQYRQL